MNVGDSKPVEYKTTAPAGEADAHIAASVAALLILIKLMDWNIVTSRLKEPVQFAAYFKLFQHFIPVAGRHGEPISAPDFTIWAAGASPVTLADHIDSGP